MIGQWWGVAGNSSSAYAGEKVANSQLLLVLSWRGLGMFRLLFRCDVILLLAVAQA
jgi:hypothetical protein